jgi:hypothetical protein
MAYLGPRKGGTWYESNLKFSLQDGYVRTVDPEHVIHRGSPATGVRVCMFLLCSVDRDLSVSDATVGLPHLAASPGRRVKKIPRGDYQLYCFEQRQSNLRSLHIKCPCSSEFFFVTQLSFPHTSLPLPLLQLHITLLHHACCYVSYHWLASCVNIVIHCLVFQLYHCCYPPPRSYAC